MPRSVDPKRAETRWLLALKRWAGRGYVVALLAPLVSGGLLVTQAFALASVLDRAIVGGAAPPALLPGIALIAGLILMRTILGALATAAALLRRNGSSCTCARACSTASSQTRRAGAMAARRAR